MPTKFGVVALFPGRPIVDQYVALDVSLQKTAVCVLNASGSVVIEAELPSEPVALTAFIQTHAPRAARVGLESGPTSPWLWHSLRAPGFRWSAWTPAMPMLPCPFALLNPTATMREALPRWCGWAGTGRFRSRASRHMNGWRCWAFVVDWLICALRSMVRSAVS